MIVKERRETGSTQNIRTHIIFDVPKHIEIPRKLYFQQGVPRYYMIVGLFITITSHRVLSKNARAKILGGHKNAPRLGAKIIQVIIDIKNYDTIINNDPEERIPAPITQIQ